MELKKTLSALDLSLLAFKQRRSPRTGFIHYFPSDDAVRDTISLFENFCFVLCLMRQKTSEAVLEGKELLLRLLAFQTSEGNFPGFLHDFPKCWDRQMAVKILPVLLRIARDFGTYLGKEALGALETSIEKALAFSQKCHAEKPFDPFGEARLLACLGEEKIPEPVTPEEWFDWAHLLQLLNLPLDRSIPYSQHLQMNICEHAVQEKGEPEPVAIEYLLAEKEGFSKRLLKDHPHQMYAALLDPISQNHTEHESPLFIPHRNGGFRLLWKEKRVHSLYSKTGKGGREGVQFHLTGEPIFGRGDLVEIALYVERSATLRVKGVPSTTFRLGDSIAIETGNTTLTLRFDLISGEGDFYGQIAKGNRPVEKSDLDAYDWILNLRTLRRSLQATLLLHVSE